MSNNQLWIILVILIMPVLILCKKEDKRSGTRDIQITSSVISVAEDTPNASIDIPVTLSGTSDKEVSIDYSTADSTATSGKDYVTVSSGKLTFSPGETSKAIRIEILTDTAQKQDLYFKVVFSNPVNGVLTRSGVTIKIINVDYATLVWSDEFDTGPLNTATWNYEQGAGGWGNNELQDYTDSDDNVHIDNGYLHITALNPSASSYTSGRITTQGKKEFTYMRVDIRAKLPEGQGIWPALWMLGSNFSSVGWAKCGEIDIMEYLGHEPAKVYGTIHWDANGYTNRGGNYTLSSGTFSTSFHLFSFIWTPNNLRWLVDGYQYLKINLSSINGFPINFPQFFIFNIAVGGNWPGYPDETTTFPQHMIVDYIRVYQ